MRGNNYKLRGEFTFKVYKPDGTLDYTVGPTSNYITNTGLTFPSIVSFADCFRYVSLGFSTTSNDIGSATSWGTTGLYSPSPYMYIGGRSDYQASNGLSYGPGFVPGNNGGQFYYGGGCGYTEKTNQVILTRNWNIPTGVGNAGFPSDMTFKEFMVSPGTPPVKGFASDGTPVSMCAAAEIGTIQGNNTHGINTYNASPFDFQLYDNVGNGLGYGGNEHSYLGAYYSGNGLPRTQLGICDLYHAFSRVLNTIAVTTHGSLNIQYSLIIEYNTGVQIFSIPTSPPPGALTSWNQGISGYSSIIHHGIKLINPGYWPGSTNTIGNIEGPDGNNLLQLDGIYNLQFESGESFIGFWGAPIEPSCSSSLLTAYLTTDNLQFIVNGSGGGGVNTSDSNFSTWFPLVTSSPFNYPLNTCSGLMQWRSTPTNDIINIGGFGQGSWFVANTVGPDGISSFVDIRRQDSSANISNNWPDVTNYYNPSTNVIPYTLEYMLPTAATNHTSLVVGAPHNSRILTGTYAFQWQAAFDSSFQNQPIRGLVLTYISDLNNPNNYLIPFLDITFSTKGTPRIYLPNVNVGGTQTIDVSSQSPYYFVENGSLLTLVIQSTWSSAPN